VTAIQIAKSLSAGMENFGTVVEFSLAGFSGRQDSWAMDRISRYSIVNTLIDRPVATIELIAFATAHPGEGRATMSALH